MWGQVALEDFCGKQLTIKNLRTWDRVTQESAKLTHFNTTSVQKRNHAGYYGRLPPRMYTDVILLRSVPETGVKDVHIQSVKVDINKAIDPSTACTNTEVVLLMRISFFLSIFLSLTLST